MTSPFSLSEILHRPSPSSSLFPSYIRIKSSPSTGVSLSLLPTAPTPTPALTPILLSPRPIAHVLRAQYARKREVCAYCWKWGGERSYKCRNEEGEDGLAFCEEACRERWGREVNADGMVGESLRSVRKALENWVRRGDDGWEKERQKANGKGKATATATATATTTAEEDGKFCTVQEIEDAWREAEAQGQAILEARRRLDIAALTPSSTSASTENGTSTASARPRTRKPPTSQSLLARHPPSILLDPLYYLLSLTHNLYLSASTTTTTTTTTSASPFVPVSLLASLHTPDPPLLPLLSLSVQTTTYLLLLHLLPTALLPHLTPRTVVLLSTRSPTNSFAIYDQFGDGDEFLGWALWAEVAFVNHSCRPTCGKTFGLDGGRGMGLWRYERQEGKREEMSICYLGDEDVKTMDLEERTKRLASWGFVCECSRCVEEREEAQRVGDVNLDEEEKSARPQMREKGREDECNPWLDVDVEALIPGLRDTGSLSNGHVDVDVALGKYIEQPP